MLLCDRFNLTNSLQTRYFLDRPPFIDMMLFIVISNIALILSSQKKFNIISYMNLLLYQDISGLLSESLLQPSPQEIMISLKKCIHVIQI